MGGFANFIGGAGQNAGVLGENERERRFRNQMETMQLNAGLQQQLAARAEALGRMYEGTHGHDFDMLGLKIGAAPLNTDFQPFIQQLEKTHKEAREMAAAKAAADARQAVVDKATVPRVGGVTPATGGGFQAPTPPPFAPMIAQAQPQAAAPPAAQPSLSPVQPAAQGGGNSPAAAFPAPIGAGGGTGGTGVGAPIPPADLQPPSTNIHSDAAISPLMPAGGGMASTGGFPTLPAFDFSNAVDEYNTMGRVGPTAAALIPLEAQLAALPPTKRMEMELGLELSKRKLDAMQQAGVFDNLPPTLKTMIQAGAYGINIPGIASLAKPMNVPGLVQTSSLPPGSVDAYGNVIDPKTTPFVRVQRSLLGGPDQYYPEMGGVSRIVQPDADSATGFSEILVDHTGNEVGRVPGVPPPAYLTQRTSVLNVPGQLPQTTVTTPVVPGINAPPVTPQGARPGAAPKSAPAIPPVRPSGGSTGTSATPRSSATPAPAPAPAFDVSKDNSLIAANYRAWINGTTTLSDKETQAARYYAQKHGLPEPIQYSKTVQDTLAKNQTALDQIDQVLSLLEPFKDDNKPLKSTWDRILYGVGIEGPGDLAQAISKISVTDILSAGRVLGSAGIRTNQVNYKDALSHTPDVWKDSGKLMYDKLNWMRQTIEDQNRNAMTYQRKSGVIPPVSGGGAPSAAPKVQRWGRDAQGNPIPLP